jgi:hypothetical protein
MNVGTSTLGTHGVRARVSLCTPLAARARECPCYAGRLRTQKGPMRAKPELLFGIVQHSNSVRTSALNSQCRIKGLF